MSNTERSFVTYRSPFGRGRLYFVGDQLVECGLPRTDEGTAETSAPAAIHELAGQLAAYWHADGPLPTQSDLPVLAGTTDLLEGIYKRVVSIPAGSTMSYSDVAKSVGRPRASRSVGAAMARNPFAPLIPCHRVVGRDGSLRGYGGGLQMKQYLLDIERGRG